MKTIVDKMRTIVRLEYKFDDDYTNYNSIDCIIDDWTMAMTSLWESYFGNVGDYHDVVEIIMGCKEVEWDQEQAVAQLLNYYANQVLDDAQYGKYAEIQREEERILYRNMLAKRSQKMGITLEQLMAEENSGRQSGEQWK